MLTNNFSLLKLLILIRKCTFLLTLTTSQVCKVINTFHNALIESWIVGHGVVVAAVVVVMVAWCGSMVAVVVSWWSAGTTLNNT